MTFKAFIFDLDGTLVDSITDLADSVNHALKLQGCPTHSLEEIRDLIGEGIDQLIKDVLPDGKKENLPFITKTLQLMAEKYAESWKNNSVLYPGIPELLDELMIRKIPLAIISNKPETFTKEMVKFLLSKWDFTAIIGGRGKYPLKPNPQSTLDIIEKLELPLEDVAFVGDGDTDVKTALAGGITPIAVTWGFRSVDKLKQAGASIFINSAEELMNYV